MGTQRFRQRPMCNETIAIREASEWEQSHAVELAVSKALLPNLLELVRVWFAETRCTAMNIAQRVEASGIIVINFSFATPECAGAFRYAFSRS